MKLSLFKEYLKVKKINLAFLVHPDINITYFTQIKPSFAFLIITPKQTVLYLTKLDRSPKLQGISIKTIKKDWKKQLAYKTIRKIGINKESLSVKYLEKLKGIYPGARFVDISLKLKELRSTKTEAEIKKIKKACQITTSAFNYLLEELPKNNLRTEKDVAFFLERQMKDKGAELAFPTIVAMAKNAAIPHHRTSDQKLSKGFLLLDFGANYQNYCSDMTRVIYLGKPSRQEIDYYDFLLKVQQEAINNIKEGLSFFDLDRDTRKSLGKFSSRFIHSLGHGLGLEIHEFPKFDNGKISINHLFTFEPGIYFPDKFGLRIEDTVLYDGKVKILTKASKQLIKVNYGSLSKG